MVVEENRMMRAGPAARGRRGARDFAAHEARDVGHTRASEGRERAGGGEALQQHEDIHGGDAAIQMI